MPFQYFCVIDSAVLGRFFAARMALGFAAKKPKKMTPSKFISYTSKLQVFRPFYPVISTQNNRENAKKVKKTRFLTCI